MSKEEFDIYGDLEDFDFGERIKTLETEVKHLSEKNNDKDQHISSLEAKIKELCDANNQLTNNLSSLMKTAKSEVARKDKTIAELRKQNDDLVFRRNRNISDTRKDSTFDENVISKHPNNEYSTNDKQHYNKNNNKRKYDANDKFSKRIKMSDNAGNSDDINYCKNDSTTKRAELEISANVDKKLTSKSNSSLSYDTLKSQYKEPPVLKNNQNKDPAHELKKNYKSDSSKKNKTNLDAYFTKSNKSDNSTVSEKRYNDKRERYERRYSKDKDRPSSSHKEDRRQNSSKILPEKHSNINKENHNSRTRHLDKSSKTRTNHESSVNDLEHEAKIDILVKKKQDLIKELQKESEKNMGVFDVDDKDPGDIEKCVQTNLSLSVKGDDMRKSTEHNENKISNIPNKKTLTSENEYNSQNSDHVPDVNNSNVQNTIDQKKQIDRIHDRESKYSKNIKMEESSEIPKNIQISSISLHGKDFDIEKSSEKTKQDKLIQNKQKDTKDDSKYDNESAGIFKNDQIPAASLSENNCNQEVSEQPKTEITNKQSEIYEEKHMKLKQDKKSAQIFKNGQIPSAGLSVNNCSKKPCEQLETELTNMKRNNEEKHTELKQHSHNFDTFCEKSLGLTDGQISFKSEHDINNSNDKKENFNLEKNHVHSESTENIISQLENDTPDYFFKIDDSKSNLSENNKLEVNEIDAMLKAIHNGGHVPKSSINNNVVSTNVCINSSISENSNMYQSNSNATKYTCAVSNRNCYNIKLNRVRKRKSNK